MKLSYPRVYGSNINQTETKMLKKINIMVSKKLLFDNKQQFTIGSFHC